MTTTQTLHDLAERLVALCNEGRHEECYDLFYAPDCVSVEGHALHPGASPVSEGLPAIRQKVAMWRGMTEMSAARMVGPFFHGDDRFAAFNTAQMKFLAGPMEGHAVQVDEVGVYTVRDGKIVREEFFLSPPRS